MSCDIVPAGATADSYESWGEHPRAARHATVNCLGSEQTTDYGTLRVSTPPAMSQRRALLGGICLIVGAVPIILTYGLQSFGYVGVVLAGFGAVVSYAGYRYEEL